MAMGRWWGVFRTCTGIAGSFGPLRAQGHPPHIRPPVSWGVSDLGDHPSPAGRGSVPKKSAVPGEGGGLRAPRVVDRLRRAYLLLPNTLAKSTTN